jgi:hypothetical protein
LSPIVLYGDSVATESSAVLAQQLSAANLGAPVIVQTYPGTALCDWIPRMIAEGAAVAPQLVVIMFIGTPARPCVAAQGSYAGSWGTDLQAVTNYWTQRGTRVLLVGLPGRVAGTPSAPQTVSDPSFPARTIDPMEAALASAGNPLVRYVDTGSEFLGPDGRYDEYLPCLPTEGPAQGCGVPPAPAGEIQVRNADGTHFCVIGHLQANQACPVYSSGVVRLAQVVAQASEGWTLPSAPATPQEAATDAQLAGLLLGAWSALMP